ncbi:MAG: type II secretion system protein GspK [Rhodospirillaceae bacterium]|nr:type II secretion system protein GspK [Rhodospirillaceae bacterium]
MLPLTLFVLAAIGLVVLAVNEWVSKATENALILKQRADFDLAIANVQNEIAYVLGTSPLTFRGLEVGRFLETFDRADPMLAMTAEFRSDRYIRLDGTSYVMESQPNIVVRLYDGRGLINLNTVAQPYVRRMLGLFGLSEPARNSLVDSLEDYTDRDDLTRISGAEVQDYTRLGMPPPANTWLMNPLETQYVMGWDKVHQLWRRDAVEPLITTCTTTGFNPNTASRDAILSTFPGIDEPSVQEVLKRRAERPFRNIREFAAVANTIAREEPFFFTFAPGSCIIIEVSQKQADFRSRFSFTIESANSKSKPWRIDYAFPVPSQPEAALPELDEPEFDDPKARLEAIFPTPDTVDKYQRPDAEAERQGAPQSGRPESVVNAP